MTRSIAWQHFTAIPGDDSAECNICQKVIKMGASRCCHYLIFSLSLTRCKLCHGCSDKFQPLKIRLSLSRCTTGLLNHTKRQHPAEWASGSSGQQRKTTADGQTFVRGTTRNPNKRSKAWRCKICQFCLISSFVCSCIETV